MTVFEKIESLQKGLEGTNADPIDAFLRKMLDTMVEGLGGDCNKHTT